MLNQSSTVFYMSQPTTVPSPHPKAVTIHGQAYYLVAFYYPDYDTPWDILYQGQFLANFYPCHLTLTINGISGSFFTAEAAFQATKWWHDDATRKQFEAAKNGNEAFQIKKHLTNPDPDYAGLKWHGAMKAVLTEKFSDPLLQQAMLLTNQAYLLEHNIVAGRDSRWSDNHDGTGENMLGKTLMEVRALYGGAAEPAGNYTVADFTAAI